MASSTGKLLEAPRSKGESHSIQHRLFYWFWTFRGPYQHTKFKMRQTSGGYVESRCHIQWCSKCPIFGNSSCSMIRSNAIIHNPFLSFELFSVSMYLTCICLCSTSDFSPWTPIVLKTPRGPWGSRFCPGWGCWWWPPAWSRITWCRRSCRWPGSRPCRSPSIVSCILSVATPGPWPWAPHT